MTLLICRTCPRYDVRASGVFARRLVAAVEATGTGVRVRGVQCLGGCPDDGVVAVDGPGKARVRFARVDESHAEAVVAAALAHDGCATGVPADWAVPIELVERISSVTPKRLPRPG